MKKIVLLIATAVLIAGCSKIKDPKKKKTVYLVKM